MKAMGVKYYRMSIAWSRIFPSGHSKVLIFATCWLWHMLHVDVVVLWCAIQEESLVGLHCWAIAYLYNLVLPSQPNLQVNERGVAFYNRVIDELIANKIMPVVTLYHWDLPLALQACHGRNILILHQHPLAHSERRFTAWAMHTTVFERL